MHAWKACVVKATAGSNPVLSAKKNCTDCSSYFFMLYVESNEFLIVFICVLRVKMVYLIINIER